MTATPAAGARALAVPPLEGRTFWIATLEHLRRIGFEIFAPIAGESLGDSVRRIRPDLILIADWSPARAEEIRILRDGAARPKIPILTVLEAPSLATVTEMIDAGAADCLRASTPSALAEARIENLLREKRGAQHSFDILETAARRDPLTGLWNHRCLQERLRFEFERVGAAGNPPALLMIDVDSFKQVNDSLGHAAGDQLLQGLARVLTLVARIDDTAARYGGDEFTLLLVGASRAAAQSIARRISQEAARGLLRKIFPTTPTVSIGLAVAPEDGATPSLLLDAADMALYQAKRLGRDQVAGVGRTVFSFEASRPYDFVGVGGDWNNWAPEQGALRRVSQTHWRGDLLLPTGRNRYKMKAFAHDIGRWFPDPENQEYEADSFGGINSLVNVAFSEGTDE